MAANLHPGLGPSVMLHLPLHKLDGASIMSDDAYGHIATVIGASWTLRGRTFDGVDDSIRVGTAPASDVTLGDFTLVVWVKPDVGDANPKVIAGKVRFTNHSWGLYHQDSKFMFQFRGAGQTSQGIKRKLKELVPSYQPEGSE